MPLEYYDQVSVVGSTQIGGPVVLVEGFEEGMTWASSGDGSDYVVDRVSFYSFEGAFSLRLKTRSVGATAGDGVSAGRYVHIGSSKRVIFDCRFLFPNLTDVADIIISVGWDDLDAGVHYLTWFDYDVTAGSWSFYHSGGSTQLTQLHTLGEAGWHRFRCEIDFRNHLYNWLHVDSVPINISEYSLYPVASGGVEYAYVSFYVYSAITGTAAVAYFDDVLILEE